MGKIDDAVGTLKSAVEKMPKDASARVALGEAYLAQNNFDGAVEQLTERLALEPTTDARLDLARAYARKHVSKQAEALYREVLKSEADNRAAKMGLVDLYLSMGRYVDAETILKDTLKSDENDLQALSRLGILKSRMGRPNEALEPLEKVSTQNPLLYDARAEYAFLLFRGDPSNSTRCINTMADILTSEPRHVLSLHYLGVCLFAKGDTQRAGGIAPRGVDEPAIEQRLQRLDQAREQGQAQATLRREQVRRARCRRPAADDPPPKIRARRRRARAHRRRRHAPAAPPARRRTSRWARCRARCRA
jgi:tetratricopeptide (TPR) repeat protein